MKQKITNDLLKKMIIELSKIRGSKYSLLVFHNKKEYSNFLSDKKIKTYEKNGLYCRAGYELNPILIDTGEELCEIYVPLKVLSNVVKNPTPMIKLNSKKGDIGKGVLASVVAKIEKGDTLLIVDEEQKFVIDNRFVRVVVCRDERDNKIYIIPIQKDVAIPKLTKDTEIYVIKKQNK